MISVILSTVTIKVLQRKSNSISLFKEREKNTTKQTKTNKKKKNPTK